MSNSPRRIAFARQTCSAWLAVAALGVLADSASAQIPLYGTEKFGPASYEINTNTGNGTLVTDTITVTMVSLARNPLTGLLYYVGNVNPQAVVTWDPQTGIETIINPSTNQQLHRLGFSWIGECYGVKLNSRSLMQLNPETGDITPMGEISGVKTGGSTGDLAFPPGEQDFFYYLTDTTLYRVVLYPPPPPGQRYDGITIGQTGMSASAVGLAFDESGRLFACTPFLLYELDLNTGLGTLIGSINHKMNDLASAIPRRPLILNTDSPAVNIGDPLNLEANGGDPFNLLALAIVGVDDLFMYRLILLDNFDADGQWSLNVPAPPGPSGHDVTFRVVGIAENGLIEETNDRVVHFN